MKKVFSLILVMAMLFSLCACELDDVPPTTGNSFLTNSTTEDVTEEETKAPTQEETEPPVETETTAPSPEETQPPTHKHSFSAATCLRPQICQECEETLGKALGHDWKGATCQAPKTCLRCNVTVGNAASHEYVDGSCTYCGLREAYSESSIMVWIPTNGGKKYHTHAGCSNMRDPEYVTLEEAEELGFTPCKRCH